MVPQAHFVVDLLMTQPAQVQLYADHWDIGKLSTCLLTNTHFVISCIRHALPKETMHGKDNNKHDVPLTDTFRLVRDLMAV